MSMNTVRIFIIVASIAGVASCTGSTDPSTATVFDNFHNLQTGVYDKQIASKKAQANAIIANNNASRGRIANLENQKRANVSQISALRAKLSRVQAQAASARSQLASQPQKLAQLRTLEKQIAGVRTDINAGAVSAASSAELNRISSAIRALTS